MSHKPLLKNIETKDAYSACHARIRYLLVALTPIEHNAISEDTVTHIYVLCLVYTVWKFYDFLSLRFYMKPKLISEVQKLSFWYI